MPCVHAQNLSFPEAGAQQDSLGIWTRTITQTAIHPRKQGSG